MVVVADAGGLVDLVADAVAHLDRPLRDGGQPGERMGLVGAEVDVPGSRPPRRDLAGQRHVDAYLVDRGGDVVAAQVPLEAVPGDAHVGVLGRGRVALAREALLLLQAAPVGQVEVDAHQRGKRLLRLGEVLVLKDDDERRAVVQVRVEIPPLEAAASAVGAGTVLPGGDGVAGKPQVLVVGLARGPSGQGVVAVVMAYLLD